MSGGYGCEVEVEVEVDRKLIVLFFFLRIFKDNQHR